MKHQKYQQPWCECVYVCLVCYHAHAHTHTYHIYTNVSECDDSICYTAPSDQIDTGKICKRMERSENDVRTVKFAMQIFGLSLRGTGTRTTVTSTISPPAKKSRLILRGGMTRPPEAIFLYSLAGRVV